MRVLIVSANRCTQPFPVLPFGACLVVQAADRAGHEVRFLDLLFEKEPGRRVESAVAALRPDLVGLSLRNIDNNDIQNPKTFFQDAAQVVQAVRRTNSVPIVLGGAAVGVMPEALLRHTQATVAVPTNGETVLLDILAALSRGADLAEVPGAMSLDDDRVRLNPPAAPGPLQDCTVADFGRWVDVRAYLSRMATVPVQTKRGCPYECVYCTYNMAEGRDYRLHEPVRVVAAIERLAAQGLRDIEFVDNVFNSPREHALAICEALARSRPPVRLQSLEINPAFADAELLEAMEQAGFVGIGITVESAADPVLQGLGKGFTAAEVRSAADVVRRGRLPCVWIFMLGGPGETPQTVRETLRFAKTCLRPTDAAFFTVGVRIYPGTPLERIARDQGVLTAPAEQMLQPIFYVSPEVELDWLRQELRTAAAEHLNFIVGEVIALPLLQHVIRVSYRLGLRPPLWQRTRSVRKMLRLLRLYQ